MWGFPRQIYVEAILAITNFFHELLNQIGLNLLGTLKCDAFYLSSFQYIKIYLRPTKFVSDMFPLKSEILNKI